MKVKSENEIAQSCPTPSDLPGSSVHGIFQSRVLEWVAIAFSEMRLDKKKELTHIAKKVWKSGDQLIKKFSHMDVYLV